MQIIARHPVLYTLYKVAIFLLNKNFIHKVCVTQKIMFYALYFDLQCISMIVTLLNGFLWFGKAV